MEALIPLGIHSTKEEECLLLIAATWSSISFVGMEPRNIMAQVRYLGRKGGREGGREGGRGESGNVFVASRNNREGGREGGRNGDVRGAAM